MLICIENWRLKNFDWSLPDSDRGRTLGFLSIQYDFTLPIPMFDLSLNADFRGFMFVPVENVGNSAREFRNGVKLFINFNPNCESAKKVK